jgi:transposase-like protein
VTVAIEDLVRLYESGLTLKQVGEEVGMSHSGVQKRLKDAGVDTRRKKSVVAPELEERIRDMYRQGKSRADIAAETGAGYRTVQRTLAGEPKPTAARAVKGWPDHRVEEAGRLYGNGRTITEVAQLLDCSGDTARGLIVRSGRRMRIAQEAAQLRTRKNPVTRPTLGEGVSEEHREACLDEPIRLACGKCGWWEEGSLRDLSARDAFAGHPCLANEPKWSPGSTPQRARSAVEPGY